MIEPLYTYEEFEENMAYSEGMKIIYGKDEVGVVCKPDVIYAVKDNIELHLRMMFPSTLSENRTYPTIFHIQGSAWFSQNMNSHMGDFNSLVKAGYSVIIIEYRPAPQHRFPCQIEDGKTAIRYVMEHIKEYPIDPSNLFLSGDSSGGHTAMMMMATWNTDLFDEEKGKLPPLNACINLYGSVNLLTMNDSPSAYDHDAIDSPSTNYLGFCAKTNPDEVVRRIPHTYIDESTYIPPVLILHGSKDRTVPFTQSLEFYNHLKQYKKSVEFYKIKNADHGGNVFYCSETIKTIIHFLNTHLK